MRRVTALVGTLILGVVLSGTGSCSAGVGPDAEDNPGTEGTGSAAELRLRLTQWQALGPRSYSYDLRRVCFCGPDAVTPARVEVRDGRVVDARALVMPRPLLLELFDTIDALFARAIEMAESGGPVVVSYHPTLGYPTFLEIGTLANDAGVRYQVSKLVALR
ncbi:MAG: DUF6174 domain-containing protein [Gemmatimonadaceae bacterium]